MSIELQHALALTRTLVVSGDTSRAAEQVNRVWTLDVHRRAGREITLLRVVLDVRVQRLDQAEAGLASLAPLGPAELQSLSDMLASTPEASNADYRRWVRRLVKRSDATASAASAPAWRAPWVLASVAAVACSALVLAAVLFLRPRQQTPEAALADMLLRLEQGDFAAIWASFPQSFRDDADLAFRAVASRLPDPVLDDYRVIDAGVADIVDERMPLLVGSRVTAIGPTFRTFAGEDDARALSSYLRMLATSNLYDREWLRNATVAGAIGIVTSGDFGGCWKTYFRSWALEDPLLSRLLGIPGVSVGQIIRSRRNIAVSMPDDGTGKVELAILMPEGRRVDVSMKRVDGCWVPAAAADAWRMATLRAQTEAPTMLFALEQLFRVRPSMRPESLDARKLMIIEAKRARTQEDFDEVAFRYFGIP